jgi:aspartate kinase
MPVLLVWSLMNTDTLVMKFGGAAVSTPERFSRIAEIIVSRRLSYPKIVVVISAMGNTTNELIALAKCVHPNPPQREYDMLITVGERISISLLAMALSLKNQHAISFTGSQSGIITTDRHTDARIVDVKPKRIVDPLNNGQIVIVAGFQGVSRQGEITTLGRGGSDTTAVALASALSAEKVEFYKDVNGIYDEDPKLYPQARIFPRLNYREASAIISRGAKVLHDRSLTLAEENHIPLHVRSFIDDDHPGTYISGDVPSRSEPLYEIREVI